MSHSLLRPAFAVILGGVFCPFAQAALIKTSGPASGVVVVGGILLLVLVIGVIRAIAKGGRAPSGGGSSGTRPSRPMMQTTNMVSRISTVNGSIQPNAGMRDAYDARMRAEKINEDNRRRTEEHTRRLAEEARRRTQENMRRNRPF